MIENKHQPSLSIQERRIAFKRPEKKKKIEEEVNHRDSVRTNRGSQKINNKNEKLY